MAQFKVIVTDNISPEGLDILKRDGSIDVDVRAGIKHDELKKLIGLYDAVITRSGTAVTADLIENPGKLKIVGRAGVGLDNVDIEAASKKGIIVMNAPTGNTFAATELTMGILLAAARKIPLANSSLKSGQWDRKKFMGFQLYDKTLGIIGLGRIGGNVAIRAKSFGMKVVAYDPYIKKSKAEAIGVKLKDTLEEVLRESDVLTVHTPLTSETHNMISAREIGMMKDGVIIINCARGGILNENDLYEALKSGKIFAAGIDVFEEEPARGNKLFDLENVFVTPHIGANTFEGQEGVAILIAEQVVDALHGRAYVNAVNIPFMKTPLPDHMQRYFVLVQKMGKLAAQLTKGRPEEIKIIMVGKNFEEDFCERTFDAPVSYQPFTVAALKGFFDVTLKDVSFINAPYLAKDRNILVAETKTDQFDKFNDLIVFALRTDQEEKTIAGTVFSDKSGRVVLFDRFHLDIIPEGTFIYFRNVDRPGIIGKVGTILGDNEINIADFELGRQAGGEAIAFVSVDSTISKKVLDDMKAIDGMLEVRVVRF
jgi:D-3-phosphoglycerate dehydrogenase